jgi:hypothetical protein
VLVQALALALDVLVLGDERHLGSHDVSSSGRALLAATASPGARQAPLGWARSSGLVCRAASR